MKRGKHEWLLALLLGGAVVVWLGDFLSGSDSSTDNTGVTPSDPKRYEVRGADWTRTAETGAPRFRVSAQSLSMHASERVAIVAPRVSGLGRDDAWRLSAPLGEVPAESRTLTLSGGVSITGSWPDGAALEGETEALTVALDAEELRSEHAVELRGPGRRMRGVGLRADTDGERLRLLDQVRVEYDEAG